MGLCGGARGTRRLDAHLWAGAWAQADGGVLLLDEFLEWPRPAHESWKDVLKWLGRPFPTEGIPWESCARESWMNSDIRRQASMRVRATMEKLAQAHADWRDGDKVTEKDLKAAVEVTWMTCEGW